VGGEENNIFTGLSRAAKAGKINLLYQQDEINEPTQGGLLSFLLFESPFNQFQQSEGATPLYLSFYL
jgi:hypothetical protein